MLAPVKAEQLHADPQVWLYHGVVSTKETDKMIEVSRNKVEYLICLSFVPTPTTTQHNQQHNLNTVVGLDMKMTVQTPPPPTPPHPPQKLKGGLQEPRISIYCDQ